MIKKYIDNIIKQRKKKVEKQEIKRNPRYAVDIQFYIKCARRVAIASSHTTRYQRPRLIRGIFNWQACGTYVCDKVPAIFKLSNFNESRVDYRSNRWKGEPLQILTPSDDNKWHINSLPLPYQSNQFNEEKKASIRKKVVRS